MGRLIQGNTSSGASTKTYKQEFKTNIWGGKTNTFTVPAGVSELKLTAVAPGGITLGSATTMAMNGSGNNVIFARMNGVDPALVTFSQQEAANGTFYIGMTGKYISGSILNTGGTQNINGFADTHTIGALTGRMAGSFFNPYDIKPWGLSISQDSSNNTQAIQSTTDGFNFTYNLLTTAASGAILYSCVFGGNGQAMVILGTGGDQVFYTSDYGITWTTLTNTVAFGGTTTYTRLRYVNGTWCIFSSATTFRYITNPVVSGVVQAWTLSSAQSDLVRDVGWTGTTYVFPRGNTTNIYISSTLSGTFTSQAHGSDLAVNTCESSPYVGGATGAISGTTLTITVAPTTGTFAIGQPIYGTGVTAGTLITAFGTGTGGVGTYTVSASQTVTSTTISAGGEVVLAVHGTATTSATSIRATYGSATTYASVNLNAIATIALYYSSFSYVPFTSGGMWVFGGSTLGFKTTTSAVNSALTLTNTGVGGTTTIGNQFSNGSVINNIQYLGTNYCSLGSNSGLGKFSSAGVITASLNTAAQLSAELGYVDTRQWAPSLGVLKNGTSILSLQGGGPPLAANGSIIYGGSGGGGLYRGGVGAGIGPCGMGTGPTSSAVAYSTVRDGTAGVVSGIGSGAHAGGGTYQVSGVYQAVPNTLVPGASGSSWASPIALGGGSLFSLGGSGSINQTLPWYGYPLTAFNSNNGIGKYGLGSGGITALSGVFYGAGGGGQGCFQYSIPVTAGDIITLNMPGCMANIVVDGGAGTVPNVIIPAGESYAYIEYTI